MKKLILLIFLTFSSCITGGFGVYHSVGENESVRSLSKLYSVDEQTLRAENNLPDDVEKLEKGSSVFIPGISETKKETTKKKPIVKPQKKTEEVIPSQKNEIEKEIPFEPIWPVKGKISKKFGGEFENKNEGIDIEVPEGTNVKAIENGKVIFSASHSGFGNMIIIQHSQQFISIYAHLQANFAKEGQSVEKGDNIGQSGKTGATETPKLHFEIREFSKPVDPEKYLSEPGPATSSPTAG